MEDLLDNMYGPNYVCSWSFFIFKKVLDFSVLESIEFGIVDSTAGSNQSFRQWIDHLNP